MSQLAPEKSVRQPFRSNRAGSISVLFAMSFPVLVGAAAFATDVGVFYLERRSLQSATDAAALAAAEWPARGPEMVRALLDASGQKDTAFQLVIGNYVKDATTDRDKRFVASPTGNAVRVVTTRKANVYFARIFQMTSVDIGAQSDAAVMPITSLSAGSSLASVDPALLNSVLKPLLGVSLNLSALDYQGLVKSRLDIGTLLKAIAIDGLAMDLTNTLAKDVLSKPIKLALMLQIMSKSLDKSGDLVGGSVLRKAAQNTLNATTTVVLGDVLKLDKGIENLAINYPGDGLAADISVLGLVNAAVARQGIGNTISVEKDLGVASTSFDLMIGESQQTARALSVSDSLPSIQTDQIRLRLQAKVELGLVNLNLPIEAVVAGGTARVVSTSCGADATKREVHVEAMPGVVKLAIGKWTGPLKDANTHDRLSRVDIATVGMTGIKGNSYASAQQVAPIKLVFRGAEIGNGTIKTAATTTIAESLVKTLIEDTEMEILGLPILPVMSLLKPVLYGLTPAVDSLLNTALATAGVSLGKLDVRVDDLVCDSPKIIG